MSNLLLREIDNIKTIDISNRLDESALGMFFKAIGLALLGHKVYTVIKGNRSEVEALEDFMVKAKAKEQMKQDLLTMWKRLRDKHSNAQKAANEFESLTGIKLEV